MTIAVEEFAHSAVELGLVQQADLDSLLDAPAEGGSHDAQHLAEKLIARNLLTRHQVEQIFAGNGDALVLGKYVILEKLGEGGMGAVFKARHPRMGRLVAIKILAKHLIDTPEAIQRFDREVRAAAQLRHPNIVAADDADEANGTHFLVMEFVDGADLSAFVRKRGPLRVEQAASCVVQAAAGLQYAHQRGIVHRDIKPSNIILDRDGTVKILDMGLARLDVENPEQFQLTGSGQIMGTVDYMAPEQALDTRSADARADIYSLGITLWFLLTGRAAYDGDSMLARLLSHRETPIPSLKQACPEVPDRLQEVFARMAAKRPEDRQQSMDEVIQEVSDALGESHSASALELATRSITAGDVDTSVQQETDADAPEPGGTRVLREPITSAPVEETVAVQSSQELTGPQTATMLNPPQAAATVERGGTKKPRRGGVVWLGAGGVGLTLLVLAGFVFFFPAKDGLVRVEINDPAIKVVVNSTGAILKPGANEQEIHLAPGKHGFTVRRGDFKFETDDFVLTSGEKVTVSVKLVKDTIQVKRGNDTIGKRTLPSPPAAAIAGSRQDTARPATEKKPVQQKPAEPLPPLPLPEKAPALAVAPFDAGTAKKLQKEWAEYLGVPVEKTVKLPGGVSLELVLIPPGEFTMGSSEQQISVVKKPAADSPGAVEALAAETPSGRVRITTPFYIGKYELTQEQWQAVTTVDPRFRFVDDLQNPAEDIRYDQIPSFLSRLNEAVSAAPPAFSLPTEAQWEYACRAGTTTLFYCGDSSEDLKEYAWFEPNAGGKTHPVGTLKPNAFGLYDMHGNVREFCADWIDADYYKRRPANDPLGPAIAPSESYFKGMRVCRGGSWHLPAWKCRSTFRNAANPTHGHNGTTGFRVVCELPGETLTRAGFEPRRPNRLHLDYVTAKLKNLGSRASSHFEKELAGRNVTMTLCLAQRLETRAAFYEPAGHYYVWVYFSRDVADDLAKVPIGATMQLRLEMMDWAGSYLTAKCAHVPIDFKTPASSLPSVKSGNQ